MLRHTHVSKRADTLFPYTTLFGSEHPLRRRQDDRRRRRPRGARAHLPPAAVSAASRREWRPREPDASLARIAPDGRRLAYVLRSEEHTSELQSLMRTSYAVFCLNKKKHNKTNISTDIVVSYI